MSNLSILVGLPVGILGFLFLFWRRLKEDYSSNQIFSFGFSVVALMTIGFFLGNFISSYYRPVSSIFSLKGLWFWGAFIFTCIGFELAFTKFKLRFFETMEAVALGFIFWFFTLTFLESFSHLDIKATIFALLSGSLLLLFNVINKHYKSFNWYKSGKVGFTGLSMFAIFFLLRSVVALTFPSMLSFVGKIDAIIDCIIAFAFLAALFNLSEI